MRKVALFFCLIQSLSLYAQEDNCEFEADAQKNFDKGWKLHQSAQSEKELLKAAEKYELVLQYNPYCEEIYLMLSNVYNEAGGYNIQHYTTARKRIDELLRFSSNTDNILKAKELLQE